MGRVIESANTVSRDKLYKEVWKVPARQLCKKYGVSDVALSKACKRHHIPRPSRGYWAKLAAGQVLDQTPLPPPSNASQSNVHFYGAGFQMHSEAHSENAFEQSEAIKSRLLVSDRLESPHPMILAVMSRQKITKKDQHVFRDFACDECPNIRVTLGALDRALRIMDCLIKAWEKHGGRIRTGKHWFDQKQSTFFALDDVEVMVALEERTVSVPDPKHYRGKAPQATGLLAFRIGSEYGDTNIRKNWSDGKKQRLEDLVDGIFAAILARAGEEKQKLLDKQIEARLEQRATARSELRAKMAREETERIESLLERVNRWHDAQRIRTYLNEIERAISDGESHITDEAAYRRWMKWARHYANQIDPLARTEPQNDPISCPINMPIDQLEFTSFALPIIGKLGVRDSDALYAVTKKQIEALTQRGSGSIWSQICRNLAALDYDISGRSFY